MKEAAMDFCHIAANRRNKKMTETFDDYFLEGVRWADAHPQSPWVSVDDYLPPTGKEVYVCSTIYSRFGEWKTKRYEGNKNEYGFYIKRDHNGFMIDHAPYYSPIMQITHWRMAPDLPKGGDK